MIGYKVAVSFDNDEFLTPFLTIVTLETLEDSTIIIPNNKTRICTEVPLIGCACEIAHHMSESITSITDKIKGWGELVKYRTDKAIVKNVVPLDPSGHKINNWNRTAYSLYKIRNMLVHSNTITPVYYKKRKQVLSKLDYDKDIFCGRGIHFFESFEDAILYTLYDESDFVSSSFRLICNRLKIDTFYQIIIRKLIKRYRVTDKED